MINEITPVKYNPFSEIKSLFSGFNVGGEDIAVAMIYYQGASRG